MAWWKFWQKEDDIASFEKELGLGGNRLGLEDKPVEETYDKLSKPGEPPVSFEAPRYDSRSVQPSQTADIQVLSAKLDTIKAMLELINQRLSSLERNAEEKQRQKLW